MLLTEYNEAKQMQLFKEDGRREGLAEGFRTGEETGIINTLVSLVSKGLLSIKDAAAQIGITEDAFQKKMTSK